VARVLLVAVVLLLAFAAPAHAGGTLFTPHVGYAIGGPSIAGDRVAWLTRSEDGFGLHVARHDGSDHAVRAIPGPERRDGERIIGQLAASPLRVAAGIHASYCVPACKYHNDEVTFKGTVSAPLGGGQPSRLEPECSPFPSEYAQVDVSGDVIAYIDSCTRKTVVRDFGAPPGQPDRFEYPEVITLDVAGPYLAFREPPPPTASPSHGGALVVREWRTGAERLRIDPIPGAYALQEDGKVAYVKSGNAYWASPEEPQDHIVEYEVSEPRVHIARDLIAVAPRGGGTRVLRLDGSRAAESFAAHPGDFDGERVVWSHRPCALFGILTWDLQGTAPQMPAGRCPLPGNRRSVLKADFSDRGHPHGTTSARLECPAEPALGCRGSVQLVAPDARRGRKGLSYMAYGGFELRPGETGEAELRFAKKRICIAGRGALRPVLEIYATRRDEPSLVRGSKRRRVGLSGIRGRLCEHRPARSP
jgi:hypothetical protein